MIAFGEALLAEDGSGEAFSEPVSALDALDGSGDAGLDGGGYFVAGSAAASAFFLEVIVLVQWMRAVWLLLSLATLARPFLQRSGEVTIGGLVASRVVMLEWGFAGRMSSERPIWGEHKWA